MHVKDAHFEPDVPTAFFCALTLWFSLDARDQPDRLRPWLLAGGAVGLAAASKYTGAVVAVVPALALLLVVLRASGERVARLRRFAILAAGMTAVSIVVFLAFNPYVVLAFDEFISPVDGIRAEINHYRTGHDGAEGNDTWRWGPWPRSGAAASAC